MMRSALLAVVCLITAHGVQFPYINNKNVTELATKYQSIRARNLFQPSYFKAKLCDHSIWTNFKTVTVTLIIPENPECVDSEFGCIYVEGFNNANFQGLPFAVNYYQGAYRYEAFSKFTFDHHQASNITDANDYVYFRALGYQGAQLTTEVRLEPSNDAVTKGQYSRDIFANWQNPPAANSIIKFDQFTRLTDDSMVKTGQAVYYGINFCVETDNNRSLQLSIIGTGSSGYAAFNTYVCNEAAANSWNDLKYGCGPGGIHVLDCGAGNQDKCIDDRDQPFNNIDIPAGHFSDELLIIAIVGQGGNTNKLNKFNLFAKLSSSPK